MQPTPNISLPDPEAVAKLFAPKIDDSVVEGYLAEHDDYSQYWQAQEGPQTNATISDVDIIFFGGTRGGGKSDCLIGRHILGAGKWKTAWNGLIIRKKFKDFAEMRRRWDELIRDGLPAERVGGDQQTNFIRFKNGAIVTMTAIMMLKQVDSFHGHQYPEISIDEAPDFPFIVQMLEKLKGSWRSPHGVPCHMFLSGNPGGPGATMIKVLFMGDRKSNKVYTDDNGETSIFVPSKLDDNQILIKKDPKYVNRLRSIKNKALREAWLNGNWDVFIGQAFDFSYENHVIKSIPVPEYAPIYMTFDWGFGKPFSVGWWWVDADGRVYRFSEWYGWDETTPDVGMRLTDGRIATGIVEREKKLKRQYGVDFKKTVTRLADPTCFNKKPDYKGGGQGPSTADVFAEKEIYLTAGDPSRALKVKQFRERLDVPDDTVEMPMMVIYDTCHQFIRTIPSLCVDEMKLEDVDTDQEDHVYDEACHICMARPMALDIPKPKPTSQAEIDWLHITGQGNTSKAFNLED